jgi:signal transduction histidine kinase
MDSLSDGVGVVDASGAFILHNPAARTLLGVHEDVDDPEQWQSHYGLYLPDGVTPFPTQDLPLVQAMSGQARSHVEMVVQQADTGRHIPISVSARPLDPKAGLPGAVAVFHDLSAIKDIQRELAEHAAQLENANRRLETTNTELLAANLELQAFSYTVSQDLRGPLRAINGFRSLLTRELPDPPSRTS